MLLRINVGDALTCMYIVLELLQLHTMLRVTDGSIGQTTRHFYFNKNKIGTGASSDVFIGVEKATGETHALKIFKDAQWSNSQENVREVEALTRMSHRNIVGYFRREEECGTGRGVLVMEYCSGGSLHSFLQQPENMHGLDDQQFLIFLNDTCQGWKYLRQRGFVHRDIKPGNILRDVKPDSSVVYKLADFGASKSVEHENGQFRSLAGTEEYLHPAMYEKAFMGSGGNTVFDESADLWSFGVTIYHACTGNIPFKPYGGVRNNRNVMFMMITCKPAGTIAGEQRSPSEDIRWKRTLPDTCNLSPTIRERSVSIIAGLLEADRNRQWTFQTLEYSVQRLKSLKKFTIISAEDAALHTIYTSTSPSLSELQEAIAMVTEVPAPHQMLFHHDQRLWEVVNASYPLSAVNADEEEPIILVNKDESEEESCSNRTLGQEPTFGVRPSLDSDLKTASKICVFVFHLLLQVMTSARVEKGQKRAELSLWSYLKHLLERVEKKFRVLSETCQEKQSRFEMMKSYESTRKEISREYDSTISQNTNKAKQSVCTIHRKLCLLKNEICRFRKKWNEHLESSPIISDTSDLLNCPIMLKSIFEETKTILQRIRRRRSSLPLSECDELMHKKDRRDLEQLCQQSISHWQHHQMHHKHPSHLKFKECKGVYLEHQETLLQFQKMLEELDMESAVLTEKLKECWKSSDIAWKHIASSVATLFQSGPSRRSRFSVRQLTEECENNKKRFVDLMDHLPELELLSLDSS
ncbi:inhibitor of nuclear factor kappa-B kinase subunit epsilon-like [Haliotis rufescens]|uniref:inhibitor of nuclear factor kappa-B kinase subunit epsilon-like n=1 Tax=Haliotis rufescens TaxID=6454 RepID=UPI00201F0CF6|nr:inhibitor of nuclear factor kappa-B kinase subunit epsilon-like [Haliotis rufescens]XP_046341592.2 inhibitor of nuclear factor kappa-B kinase subunit epsilon-like [Haliotis rufescens]XP_046341593.2 inhibitor of nuclear factor kappa-B kinase subunit epsilon-like [Haliotis rufescens]